MEIVMSVVLILSATITTTICLRLLLKYEHELKGNDSVIAAMTLFGSGALLCISVLEIAINKPILVALIILVAVQIAAAINVCWRLRRYAA